MSDRDSFLARVKLAAAQGRAHRVAFSAIPERTGYIGAGGDLAGHFAQEVTAVGGQAFRVANLAEAAQCLRELLTAAAASKAVCWQHELLARLGLSDILQSLNVAQLEYASLAPLSLSEQRAAILDCDVGLTSCDCAIAETGTLMMWSATGRERVASLVAPLHIAIVERAQIVPDLFDAFELLTARHPSELPSNVTLITGPSKTGDIELQLTTGVHGPGKWQVIIVG